MSVRKNTLILKEPILQGNIAEVNCSYMLVDVMGIKGYSFMIGYG